MALFGSFGNLISGGLSILGGSGGTLGQFGQLGSTLLNVAQAGRGAPIAVGPGIQMGAARMPTPPGLRTFSGVTTAIGSGITRVVAPILIIIAETLGRRSMSLRQAVRIIRKMGKFLTPAAAAVALGITVDQMADLIMADANRTRRRMNPANVTALRRSMRRIQSFHRLCQKADVLKGSSGRRRRAPSSPRVGGQIVQVK